MTNIKYRDFIKLEYTHPSHRLNSKEEIELLQDCYEAVTAHHVKLFIHVPDISIITINRKLKRTGDLGDILRLTPNGKIGEPMKNSLLKIFGWQEIEDESLKYTVDQITENNTIGIESAKTRCSPPVDKKSPNYAHEEKKWTPAVSVNPSNKIDYEIEDDYAPHFKGYPKDEDGDLFIPGLGKLKDLPVINPKDFDLSGLEYINRNPYHIRFVYVHDNYYLTPNQENRIIVALSKLFKSLSFDKYSRDSNEYVTVRIDRKIIELKDDMPFGNPTPYLKLYYQVPNQGMSYTKLENWYEIE